MNIHNHVAIAALILGLVATPAFAGDSASPSPAGSTVSANSDSLSNSDSGSVSRATGGNSASNSTATGGNAASKSGASAVTGASKSVSAGGDAASTQSISFGGSAANAPEMFVAPPNNTADCEVTAGLSISTPMGAGGISGSKPNEDCQFRARTQLTGTLAGRPVASVMDCIHYKDVAQAMEIYTGQPDCKSAVQAMFAPTLPPSPPTPAPPTPAAPPTPIDIHVHIDGLPATVVQPTPTPVYHRPIPHWHRSGPPCSGETHPPAKPAGSCGLRSGQK